MVGDLDRFGEAVDVTHHSPLSGLGILGADGLGDLPVSLHRNGADLVVDEVLGAAQQSLTEASVYSTQRQAFGEPLAIAQQVIGKEVRG